MLNDKQLRIVKRTYQRMFAGFACRNEHLLVTLTTSSSYHGNLNRDFRKFLSRLQRAGIERRYFAVRERNALNTCTHIHCVFTGDNIPIKTIRKNWLSATGGDGKWTHIKKIRTPLGMVRYLCKYLVKQFDQDLPGRHFWMSNNWVYPGWVTDSKMLYKCGIEFDEAFMVSLANARNRHIGLVLKASGALIEIEQKRKIVTVGLERWLRKYVEPVAITQHAGRLRSQTNRERIENGAIDARLISSNAKSRSAIRRRNGGGGGG